MVEASRLSLNHSGESIDDSSLKTPHDRQYPMNVLLIVKSLQKCHLELVFQIRNLCLSQRKLVEKCNGMEDLFSSCTICCPIRKDEKESSLQSATDSDYQLRDFLSRKRKFMCIYVHIKFVFAITTNRKLEEVFRAKRKFRLLKWVKDVVYHHHLRVLSLHHSIDALR